jgi:hypothetical protein
MKTLLAFLVVCAALGGCAVVPYEPAPVVYAAPVPAPVFVRPYGYYYYRGGPYWHRGWH